MTNLEKLQEWSSRRTTRSKRNPKGDGPNDLASLYRIEKDGLYYGGDNPLWLCGPFEIVAETFNPATRAYGLLLRWADYQGVQREQILPRGEFCAPSAGWRRTLMNNGLSMSVGRSATDRLGEYFARVRCGRMVMTVDCTGWFQAGDGEPSFVLVGEVIGRHGEVRLNANPEATSLQSRTGSLEDWQQKVAALAVGNSRLVLSVCAALAVPLLLLNGHENGGLHLRGSSSLGKTTALVLAASVWGNEPISWRATVNGLEATAALHNDRLLCIDEIGQCDPTEVGEVAYMLANGKGKSRARQDGGARNPATWRILFLSTGEVSLADLMPQGNKRLKAGQDVRFLDIPADARSGLGLFDTLPEGFTNAGAFADHLQGVAKEQCGTAGPAFIRALLADGRLKEHIEFVNAEVQAFVEKRVPPDAAGQVVRAARRFGSVTAAGKLAARLGVLPWSEGEPERAAAICFSDWLEARGGHGLLEVQQARSQLEALLSRYANSRFQRLRSLAPLDGSPEPTTEKWVIADRWGFVVSENGNDVYYLFPSVWKEHVAAGMDMRTINRAFVEMGILEPDAMGKASVSVRMDGRQQRLYKVRADRLGPETKEIAPEPG